MRIMLPSWWRRSAGAKVIVGTLVVLTAIMVWTTIRQVRSERRDLYRDLDYQGQFLALSAAQFAIEPLLLLDYPYLDTLLQQLVAEAGDVVGARLLYDGQTPVEAAIRGGEDTELLRTYRSDLVLRTDGTGPSPVSAPRVLGTIEIILSPRRTEERLARIWYGSVFQALTTGALLALVLILLLRVTTLRPLEHLTGQAERLANGALDHPIQLAAEDEFGVLARTLEGMRQRVQQGMETLESQNDQLRTLDQLKSRFMATMSHEIRTPLNGVLGCTEILAHMNLDQEAAELVGSIDLSGRVLSTLLNDILDFTCMETDRLCLEHAVYSPAAVVSHALDLTVAPIGSHHLDVQFAVQPDTPEQVLGDGNRVRQVIQNLTNNAFKFTEHGHVHVRLGPGRTAQSLYIEVEDTGGGVPEQLRPRLFHPFQQGDGSMSRRFGGAGLGLSICRSLVELMGGTIGFKERPGGGSIFWIEIPYQTAPPSAVADPGGVAESSAPVPTNLSLRILLVEDTPLNQKVAERMLARLGHDTRVADNGALALEILDRTEQPFDVILMDCQMPEMDGFMATAAIRNRADAHADTRIVAVTANSMDSDRERCLQCGMDDLLAKPFKMDQLAAILQGACKSGARS